MNVKRNIICALEDRTLGRERHGILQVLVVVDSQGVEMDFVISWNPVMRWLSILNCQMASISTRLSFTIILIGL